MSRTQARMLTGMLGMLILDLFGTEITMKKNKMKIFSFSVLGLKFKNNMMFVRFRFGLCLVQISRRMCVQNDAGLYIRYKLCSILHINLFISIPFLTKRINFFR